MDAYRFFVPDLLAQAPPPPGPISGGAAALDGESPAAIVQLPSDQQHHARSVLRLSAGETLVVFDGRGAWAPGTLADLPGRAPRGLAVRLSGPIRHESAPTPRLTLATAVPKGDRAQWLVEQASQLNAAAVQWLDCQRSVARPRHEGGKMGKWRRLAIESAKQCGRTHLLEVHEPATIDSVLTGASQRGAIVLWLEPRHAASSPALAKLLDDRPAEIIALIGPEGGWSPEESAHLEAAATRGRLHRIRLTDTILRIETACAAIAAIVMSRR